MAMHYISTANKSNERSVISKQDVTLVVQVLPYTAIWQRGTYNYSSFAFEESSVTKSVTFGCCCQIANGWLLDDTYRCCLPSAAKCRVVFHDLPEQWKFN